jgi:hypothetical protein
MPLNVTPLQPPPLGPEPIPLDQRASVRTPQLPPTGTDSAARIHRNGCPGLRGNAVSRQFHREAGRSRPIGRDVRCGLADSGRSTMSSHRH